jgi:hypothetical protein
MRANILQKGAIGNTGNTIFHPAFGTFSVRYVWRKNIVLTQIILTVSVR